MKYQYATSGTCTKLIEFEIDNGIVNNVKFAGGCHGNLQGIAALTNGMAANDVIEKLQGIKCGSKCTSCPDQLAQALQQAIK